ncbi:hypothetical protein ROZALSC1DRAFT_28617 [Rozella allomycis CSF55]|uniref:Uncharacterized protein n=1 Tax=Rozella allomycis (strain CSF55) TaxID=988480 RepID=A0A075AU95_ROZAC|nr:hypothetical protein O9G_003984 [Rozella allomycis CSF55]RKP19828.1 hypothetical protein ROZALSC1DRAFT_28617 [Rozella allomycis CSF55]|eukprot:EPZ33876.1 hypothetical protein O9G_003984 [Rozella allomycis CSF55]
MPSRKIRKWKDLTPIIVRNNKKVGAGLSAYEKRMEEKQRLKQMKALEALKKQEKEEEKQRILQEKKEREERRLANAQKSAVYQIKNPNKLKKLMRSKNKKLIKKIEEAN